MHLINEDSTSQSIDVFIQDSSSTTGAGKTGLAFNTASLTAYYRRGATGSPTAITLATLANAQAAWSSGGFVEIDATNQPGMYRLDVPDAVLANGVDRAQILLKGASNMAPVAVGITLLDPAPDVNVTKISGDSTAADNAEAFFDGTGYAGTNNVIPTVTTLTGHTAQTGDAYARLGAPAGASVSADIAAIEAQTDDIGAAGAGLTAVPWNAAWDAEVQSEVQDAIEANHLDHLLAVTYDPASKPGASDALLNELVESDAGVARYTANALEQAPTGGSAPTAATIADAVWDELLSGHVVSGSAGEALEAAGTAGDPWTTALPGAYGSGTAGKIIGDNINATISSRASQTSVDDLPTNAELATALAAADDAILAAIAALNNLSQANIRTALGMATANLDTQLDALPTTAELATALASADDAVLAAIAALNNLSSAQAQTAAAAALTAYDPPTKAELDTAVDALPTAVENAAAVLAAATANPIDANVQEINDVTLVGDGSTTPWGPV
jgi:hypothetical protein